MVLLYHMHFLFCIKILVLPVGFKYPIVKDAFIMYFSAEFIVLTVMILFTV